MRRRSISAILILSAQISRRNSVVLWKGVEKTEYLVALLCAGWSADDD
jgi:hypothetical protein